MGIQYPPQLLSGAVAGGVLTLIYRPPVRGHVSQVSVEMSGTGAASASCVVRRNGALVCPLVPTGDAAAGDPPVPLAPPGDQLTVEWTSAPNGLVGTATIFFTAD